ncbi:MAG: helix-turn-helix transcriptional regulator [Gemmatimonas sp.]|uniref:helix-turn-helix transcriptional regulator n=1 Tax=Gemmatimonas sp. TaxID=1962908 RepID=UPI00391F5D3E|nr:AraC family transcriptional regulator [Gemmatimonadota bacterium]
MSDAARSAVAFRAASSRRRIEALAGARMLVTSRALDWPGLLVERGVNTGWDVDGVTVDAHYFALNLDPTPLPVLVRDPGHTRVETLRPGAGWFCPAGERFSHKVDVSCHFVLCTMSPPAFARWLGLGEGEPPPPLARRYNVRVTALGALLRVLEAEAANGGAGGLEFIDAVGRALALQFVQQFGVGETPARGGLSATARRTVLAQVQAHLADPPSVPALAHAVGLSVGHFQRAFRASFGRSPVQQMLAWRLEAARRALLDAPSVSTVAATFGFADHSHFTRLFRRQFGVTPGAVLGHARGSPRDDTRGGTAGGGKQPG